MTASALLELDSVSKRFGRVVVADRLSLQVAEGSTLGVVGPNGAGKTSLFGMISGEIRPDSGQVRFAGSPITRAGTARRVQLGVGRTHQVPRPFTGMTVFENVLVAAQQGGGLRASASVNRALDALAQCRLSDRANTLAGELGLLARKRLELARAMAIGPRLLLLDEVAGGLTDPEVAELVSIVRGVSARGVTVIWIEHVVRALLSAVERLVCLAFGTLIADGAPRDVLARQEVKELFLGTESTVAELTEPPPKQ